MTVADVCIDVVTQGEYKMEGGGTKAETKVLSIFRIRAEEMWPLKRQEAEFGLVHKAIMYHMRVAEFDSVSGFQFQLPTNADHGRQ